MLGGHGTREQREDRGRGEQQQQVERPHGDHLVAVVAGDRERRRGEQVVQRRLEGLVAQAGETDLARVDRAAAWIDILLDRLHLP